MRRLGVGLFAALLLAPAGAQSPVLNGFPPGAFQSRGALDAAPAASYTGPGDIVSGATAWWGLRGYNAAYSGNAANICLPLDATCADVAISSGNLALGTITTLGCNNTTAICTVKTLYDQTGNGNTATQATIAQRPILSLSCLGSLPCMTFTRSSNQCLATSASFAVSQPFSASAVAERIGAFTAQAGIVSSTSYGGTFAFLNSTNTLEIYNGIVQSVTAADSAFHAMQSTFNSASSLQNVDGSATTINTGSFTLSGNLVIGDVATACTALPLTGKMTEAGYWPSGFTSGNQTSLNSNQHTYWGF